MTVRELKEILNHADPDQLVSICVNSPSGWVCPDGCTVEVKAAYRGIDWHGNEILLAPMYKLDIHDVDEWSGKPKKEQKKKRSDNKKEPKKKKPDKKESLIHGYTVPEYIQLIEKAHEASKNSKLVFK